MRRTKAVVTASLNGVLTDPVKFGIPVTAKELGLAAAEARDEGAAVVHVHFRDQRAGKGHLPTWDPRVASDVRLEIEARARGVLVNFTTGTFGADGGAFSGGELGPTGGPIACLENGRPDMAALNAGSLNYLRAGKTDWAWKPLLFDNPVDKVKTMLDAMTRLGVVPEFECFDTGIVRSVRLFERVGLLAGHKRINVSFVMGVASGMAADPDLLPILIKELALVENVETRWQVIAVGDPETVWPLLRRACELGGNVRAGLEDCLYLPNRKRAATVEARLARPVVYSNDGNAAALYAHVRHCGPRAGEQSSISAIVGTGLGGGVIEQGAIIAGPPGRLASLVMCTSRWKACSLRASRCHGATAASPAIWRASRR